MIVYYRVKQAKHTKIHNSAKFPHSLMELSSMDSHESTFSAHTMVFSPLISSFSDAHGVTNTELKENITFFDKTEVERTTRITGTSTQKMTNVFLSGLTIFC